MRKGITMDNKALYKLTHGVYVVGIKDCDKYGGCIVDAVAQASSGPIPNIVLCSMLKNYTNELIKKEKECTLSILGTDIDPFVISNFGFQSARTVDKWANVQYEIIDGLPVVKNAVSYVRLKLSATTELDTHSMFLFETVDAWLGTSEADSLVFGDYQKGMKTLAMDAFKKFNEDK